MSAAKYDIVIQKGESFKRIISLRYLDETLINFSNYANIVMQIRDTYDSDILADSTGIIDLSVVDSCLEIEVASSDTADLDFKDALYDIKLVGDNSIRILEGSVNVV